MCQTFVISLKHFSRAQRSDSKSTDCRCVNQEEPDSSLLNVHGNVSWSGWGLSLRVQELCGQYKHGLKGWSSRDPTDFPNVYLSEYSQVNQIIIDVSNTQTNAIYVNIINTTLLFTEDFFPFMLYCFWIVCAETLQALECASERLSNYRPGHCGGTNAAECSCVGFIQTAAAWGHHYCRCRRLWDASWDSICSLRFSVSAGMSGGNMAQAHRCQLPLVLTWLL